MPDIDAHFSDWNYGHPKVLYGLIRSMRPQVVVEVGTYLGYGAAWMAQALKENGSGILYVIDNWSLNDRARQGGKPLKHFWENMRALELDSRIIAIDGDSDKVDWPDRIDFAYIDGWHSFDAAWHDFCQAERAGATCICMDDTTNCIGPRMALEEARSSGDWEIIEVFADNGLAICMRRRTKGPITFSQELPNHPGVDLQTLTRAGQAQHLHEAALANGNAYDEILHRIAKPYETA